MRPGYYSEHFSRKEMRFSMTAVRKGLRNVPSVAQEANLERLCCDFLEPVRMRFGALQISSGYRSRVLNSLIGGSTTSAHMEGLAADFVPLDKAVSFSQVVEWVRDSTLPFDQVIYEFGEWVHLGIPPPGAKPRRQVLMIFTRARYEAYDARQLPLTV